MAIIDDEKKYIFIHVPKVAGISICRTLGHEPNNHSRLQVLQLSDAQRDYFKFMFVRNPYERLVVAYEYFLHNGRGAKCDKRMGAIVRQFSGFKPFVATLEVNLERYCKICSHFRPQEWWYDDSMDVVERYENLQDGFDSVCENRGITKRALLVENYTNTRPYAEYYDEKTRAIAANIYAADIKRYRYSFG